MVDIRAYSIADINKSCLDEFRAHWECLDNYNQRLWQCRRQEQFLNACVFDKLVCLISITTTLVPTSILAPMSCNPSSCSSIPQGLKKTIPGTPGKEIPVHLRHRQIFADSNENRRTLTGPGSDETEFRGKLLGQWRAESAPDKEKKFAEAMAKAEKFKESTEADFKRAEEEGKLSWRQKVGYNAFLRGWSNVIDTTDMRERQREGLVAGKGEESEE